jgi:hypothetical protein
MALTRREMTEELYKIRKLLVELSGKTSNSGIYTQFQTHLAAFDAAVNQVKDDTEISEKLINEIKKKTLGIKQIFGGYFSNENKQTFNECVEKLGFANEAVRAVAAPAAASAAASSSVPNDVSHISFDGLKMQLLNRPAIKAFLNPLTQEPLTNLIIDDINKFIDGHSIMSPAKSVARSVINDLFLIDVKSYLDLCDKYIPSAQKEHRRLEIMALRVDLNAIKDILANPEKSFEEHYVAAYSIHSRINIAARNISTIEGNDANAEKTELASPTFFRQFKRVTAMGSPKLSISAIFARNEKESSPSKLLLGKIAELNYMESEVKIKPMPVTTVAGLGAASIGSPKKGGAGSKVGK